jgi:hypothetical protein
MTVFPQAPSVLDAVKNRHDSLATILVQHGANIDCGNADGGGLLGLAVCAGCVETCKAILNRIDMQHVNSAQLFTFAIGNLLYKQEEDMVTLLVTRGANVNQSFQGIFPIHKAAGFHELNIVKILVEQGGADVNTLDPHGSPMLCWQGLREAMRIFLLSHGADVNKSNRNGDTPLEIAVRQNDHTVVSLLVRYNANIYKRRPSGFLWYEEGVTAAPGFFWYYASGLTAACLLHTYILDITLAMSPLDLPAYVLLWILDWNVDRRRLFITELQRITLISNVVKSIRRVKQNARCDM